MTRGRATRYAAVTVWLLASVYPVALSAFSLVVLASLLGADAGRVGVGSWIFGAISVVVVSLIGTGLAAYLHGRAKTAWWLLGAAYLPIALAWCVQLYMAASSLNLHAPR